MENELKLNIDSSELTDTIIEYIDGIDKLENDEFSEIEDMIDCEVRELIVKLNEMLESVSSDSDLGSAYRR